MAIFDFLNSTQSGTQNVTTSIDPQVKQAYLANLNFADTVASRPYEQYSGPRIAGFTPEQQQAFSQIQGMQGQFQPALTQAQQATQGVAGMNPNQINAGSFLTGNIGAYQNPYTSQVIDQTMQDLNRQRAIDKQGLNAQAIRSGAFGGTRQAIAEQELNRNYNDQFARTAANLRNQGFDTAANLMQSDMNRNLTAQQANEANRLAFGSQRLGAAGQMANLAGQQQALGLNATNALNQVGQQQQAQTQRSYDLANQDFQNQFNYPLQQLAIRQGALGAQIPNAGQTQSTPLYSNPLGTLLGAGIGLNQLFGGSGGTVMPGGQTPVGSFLGGLGTSLGGLLDFDGSGGLNFGDIGAGFNQGANWLSGLFS